MFPAIYVSADELERADAYRLGYRTVCWHPREIGLADVSETLVIDFDHILFDDQETAVMKASAAARRGVLVGVHTHYPQALKLYRLVALPNVLVATTHRRLLVKLGHYAKLHGRPWLLTAQEAKLVESEVNDVPDNPEEGTVGA